MNTFNEPVTAFIAAADADTPIPAEPSVLKKSILHILEAAGLTAVSFALTQGITLGARIDMSHQSAEVQAVWNFALPVLTLGVQSALKYVEAQKQTILAQKTMAQATKMMKSMKTSPMNLGGYEK